MFVNKLSCSLFNNFQLIKNIMNKAVVASIGIGVVLVVLAVLFMTDQSGENGVELNEELKVGSASEESQSFEVEIVEGLAVSTP